MSVYLNKEVLKVLNETAELLKDKYITVIIKIINIPFFINNHLFNVEHQIGDLYIIYDKIHFLLF